MIVPQEGTGIPQSAAQPELQANSITRMISAQAARRPDEVAVTAGPRSLTYHELDCQANRLARRLRSLGVGADVLVGLCLPRSLDLVIGALGILKAGGAYVPMDPAYPNERLAYMLDDANAPVLVTSSSIAHRLPEAKRDVVNIDGPEVAAGPDHLPRVDVMPHDLAYVIYTSGSTGKPKGVEITHQGLTNLVTWHRRAFSVTAADRASHVAGLGFDASVWELWPYLAAGATVVLVDELSRNSPEFLRDWMVEQSISIGFVPTPIAERMLSLDWPAETRLRRLLTGGDALHHYPSAKLPFTVINNYGPTECSVVATSGLVRPEGADHDVLPPIGTAIANTIVYLLDENLDPVPPGTPGEIHIAGAGLARGYHNRPELTAEKFIPNPFCDEAGSRLYKTGDLARLLPDGQIAFMGRIDDQIKIRGYRIEPKEIVAALNRHPEIRDSLVVAREDTPDDKRLVAYIVTRAEAPITHTSLRDFLREDLPEHMLPSVFVTLAAFPVTANGKIDTAGLPQPDVSNTLQDPVSVAPLSPIEKQIAEMVTGMLGLEEIGRDDNFFLLGGHSLLGAQLIARLRKTFGVEITLRSLFAAPTVAALAAEIERLSYRAA
jgi:amino acid adenylation domain-containing protein